MPSLKFSASDKTVVLVGGIFHASDPPSTAHPVAQLTVQNGVSSAFTVPAGQYRYEFNIHGTAKFTLSLARDPEGTPEKCFPGPFDPQDPALGPGAALDRKSFFFV